MRLALRCACVVWLGGAGAVAQAAALEQGLALAQRPAADPQAYQPRLPLASGQRLPSPSELDELMGELPVIDYKTNDGGGRERGFSFGVKPGKNVKAIARFRF